MTKVRPRPAEIFKALVKTDDGSMAHGHVISYEDAIWFVPKWIENPYEQTTRPERMIRLDDLVLEPGGSLGPRTFDFFLNVAIPKTVLKDPIHSKTVDGFVVIGSPDIKFPMNAVSTSHTFIH